MFEFAKALVFCNKLINDAHNQELLQKEGAKWNINDMWTHRVQFNSCFNLLYYNVISNLSIIDLELLNYLEFSLCPSPLVKCPIGNLACENGCAQPISRLKSLNLLGNWRKLFFMFVANTAISFVPLANSIQPSA